MANKSESIINSVSYIDEVNNHTITHPKLFLIEGVFFQVLSYIPLSEVDAGDIAKQYYQKRKFKKSDKGKTVSIVTLFGLDNV